MFQLLAVIIAILIIVVLAGIAVFYGGDVFTSGSGKVEYSQMVNSASQIGAALHLYLSSNGRYPTGSSEEILSTLVDGGYLTNRPEGEWTVGNNLLVSTIKDIESCERINAHSNIGTDLMACPPCDDLDYVHWPACYVNDSGSEEGGEG